MLLRAFKRRLARFDPTIGSGDVRGHFDPPGGRGYGNSPGGRGLSLRWPARSEGPSEPGMGLLMPWMVSLRPLVGTRKTVKGPSGLERTLLDPKWAPQI